MLSASLSGNLILANRSRVAVKLGDGDLESLVRLRAFRSPGLLISYTVVRLDAGLPLLMTRWCQYRASS